MEITFEVPSVETRVIDFDEEDLAKLNDIVRHMAIRHLQVAGLAFASYPPEEQAVELCQKYGIDPLQKGAVVSFFSALLCGPPEPNVEEGA